MVISGSEALSRLRSFQAREFRPAPCLPGGHLQTIAGWLFRKSTGIVYNRKKLELSDGDFLNLDIHPPDYEERGKKSFKAVAVLIHGLEGSSRSGYIQQLARRLEDRGILTVAMNLRSCGGEMNRRNRFYCAANSDDLAEVLEWCADRFVGKPLLGAGFSLGGVLLLKYLGERGKSSLLKAAAGISVPLNLNLGVRRIENGFSRLYNKFFTFYLRRKGRRKKQSADYELPVEEVEELENIREFDDLITAPLWGFDSAEDYYKSCGANNFIPQIKTPTLLVQAQTDPMIAWDEEILEQIARSKFIRLLQLERGGHMGFVEGRIPLRPEFWLEEELARYFSEIC